MNAQHGIYALGTPEHCFLELDLVDGVDPIELVRAAAGLTGPLSTIGGVNVVVGFRPQLWEQVAPDDAPAEVHSFDEDIVGPDGFTMPATQHDARRVLLFQLWPHDTPAWAALPDDAQEKVIGRTKPDSIELSEKDMPDDSHVSRTVLEVNGVGRVRARSRKRLGDPVVPAVVWPAYRPSMTTEVRHGPADLFRDCIARRLYRRRRRKVRVGGSRRRGARVRQ